MTLIDYYNRKIPDYYPTMAQDGYRPHEILAAVRSQILSDYWERSTRDADEPAEVHITSEVKTK